MKVTYVAIYFKHNPEIEDKYFFVDFRIESLHSVLPPIELLSAEDCLGFALAKYKELGIPLPKPTPINMIHPTYGYYFEKKEITIELNDYAGTAKRKPKKFIPDWLYRFDKTEYEKSVINREKNWVARQFDILSNTDFDGKHRGFMEGRPWIPRALNIDYKELYDLN